MLLLVCSAVILGGDSLKHKLDTISDTVTDNVRETGNDVLHVASCSLAAWLIVSVDFCHSDNHGCCH